MEAAFADPQPDAAPLFHLPVTKSWLRQSILAQLLIGHASLRGVTEILQDVFGSSLSIGTVHNVVQEAIVEAQALLLAFARSLALRLQEIAREYASPVASLYAFCELQNLNQNQPLYWQRQPAIRSQLGTRYHAATSAVQEAFHQTVRASSLVENLTSRLRNYFFLRRQIGDDYLVLLRFFLNHRRFLRSENPERAGKSPAELRTGRTHPHWLEVLGFVRFTLN